MNKKKLAVVAGGWHFPLHFYEQIKNQKIPSGWEVDLFCVSHRNPNLEIVRTEKNEYLSSLGDSYPNRMDKLLYSEIATVEEIENLGWNYVEEPNSVGDWGMTNQWLDKNDYRDYDVFLFTHDDNFIFNDKLFTNAISKFDWDEWLVITNGPNHGQRPLYPVRGSFDFFKKEMLDMIGGKFDLSLSTVTRLGKVDTPKDESEIRDWNGTVVQFGHFIKNNNLYEKIKKLSDTYRISTFCFEGERGYMSNGGYNTMYPIIKFINENIDMSTI
jgi:hypothetical protein